jgi:hypothetical protein
MAEHVIEKGETCLDAVLPGSIQFELDGYFCFFGFSF